MSLIIESPLSCYTAARELTESIYRLKPSSRIEQLLCKIDHEILEKSILTFVSFYDDNITE